MAEKQGSSTHAAKQETNNPQTVVPPTSTVINPALTTPCTKEKPCYTEDAAPHDLLPEWRRPEWVIVYVTVLYVLIAGLTLRAIKRQANIMAQQAKDSRDEAAAAAVTTQATLAAINKQADQMAIQSGHMETQTDVLSKSVAISEAQIQNIKEKERAKIKIKRRGLTLNRDDETWSLQTSIEIRNVGPSPAYILDGSMNLEVRYIDQGTPTTLDMAHEFSVVEDYIAPLTPLDSPIVESCSFFPDGDDKLSDFEHAVVTGKYGLYLYGVIVYGTVGTHYRRAFCYTWVPSTGGRRMVEEWGIYRDIPPVGKLITAGYWHSAEYGPHDEIELWTKTQQHPQNQIRTPPRTSIALIPVSKISD